MAETCMSTHRHTSQSRYVTWTEINYKHMCGTYFQGMIYDMSCIWFLKTVFRSLLFYPSTITHPMLFLLILNVVFTRPNNVWTGPCKQLYGFNQRENEIHNAVVEVFTNTCYVFHLILSSMNELNYNFSHSSTRTTVERSICVVKATWSVGGFFIGKSC